MVKQTKKYIPPKCDYYIEGGHIVTDGKVHNKITGTALAAVLGKSPYNTPFQIACALLGVAREDISDKAAVKVGQALEGPIIEYAERAYPQYGMFLPAEDIYAQRIGDHDSWSSDFLDDYFAGHVDGIVMSDDGQQHILEIKTTINYGSWVGGVPEHYYWQVALYNEFITKQDKAYVVLGMVTDETHKDPKSWIPNDKNVALFEMGIDREDVAEKMDQAKKWYDDFIMNNITPDYDPTNPGDVAMYEHLSTLVEDVKTMQSLVGQLAHTRAEIAKHEAEKQVLYDFKESTEKRLKDYMGTHNLTTLSCEDAGFRYVCSEYTRSAIDEEKLAKDGIDINKYKIEKPYKRYEIREIKKNKESM